MVCRQSKQEDSSTNPLAITIHTSQNNTIHNFHRTAAFARQKSRFRGFVAESGALLSRAGRYKARLCSAIWSTCKYYPAHQNREDNVNKNVKTKPFPSPATAPKFWSWAELALKNVYLWNQMKSSNVLMYPRYFRYSIGLTGRIHREGRRSKH